MSKKKTKRPTPDEELVGILKRNRQIDPTALAEGLEVLRQLRESGLAKEPGYRIQPPFSKPMRQVTDDDGMDERKGTASARW